MTIKTDIQEINQAVTTQNHSLRSSTTGSGGSKELYAEFSAMLDKISVELQRQEEFSGSMIQVPEVKVKAKEIQDPKPHKKSEVVKVDSPESENLESASSSHESTEASGNQHTEQAPSVAAKDCKQQGQDDQKVEAQDSKAEESKAEDNSEAVSAEVESENGNPEAEYENTEEISAAEQQAVECLEHVKAMAQGQQQVSNDSSSAPQIEVANSEESQQGELVQDFQEQDLDSATEESVLKEVVTKELRSKQTSEVVEEQPVSVVTQQEVQTDQGQDVDSGDGIVEKMARALLGRMNSKESEEMSKMASDKVAVNLNQSVLPQPETVLNNQSMQMGAGLLKQLIENGQKSLEQIVKSSNVQPVQTSQVALPASTRELNLSEQFKELNNAKTSSTSLPKSLASRTLQRVEEALKEVSKSKDGNTISVRLDPPSLGSVKVDVSLKEGSLHARFIAESPAVTHLLRERTGELQGILRKLGFESNEVKISVGYESGSELADNFAQDLNQHNYKPGSNFDNNFMDEVDSSNIAVPLNETSTEDHWIA